MHIIGLLGGVASGKSEVARQLAKRGAGVLDADRAGHEVLRLPHVEEAARQRWGEGIFGPDGHIDRSLLAKVVFSPPPKGPIERRYLEQLTHPEIGRRLAAEAQRMAAGGTKVAVLDAALILEADWDRLCEKLVFVDAPRDVRRARALARGWSEQEFAAREDAQDSLDSKRKRADVTVDNSGSLDHTEGQVERLWQSLIG
jgi:dephospho-CoA kinase